MKNLSAFNLSKINKMAETNETFTNKNGFTVSYSDIYDGILARINELGKSCSGTLTQEDIEDLFMRCAEKVSKAKNDFDETKSSPQAYGYLVAKRESFTLLSKAIRERDSRENAPDTEDFEDIWDSSRSYGDRFYDFNTDSSLNEKEIWGAINSLKEEYREVLTLTAQGYKPREIAEILGTEAAKVSNLLFKARKELRKRI